jgi:hypothetical protein
MWRGGVVILGSIGANQMAIIRRVVCLFLITLLTGCTDYQLKRNTLGVATSIEELYKQQALENISKFIDHPDSIPSQVDISSGNIQTSGSAQVQISIPYGNQVTEGVASGISTVVNGVPINGFRAIWDG